MQFGIYSERFVEFTTLERSERKDSEVSDSMLINKFLGSDSCSSSSFLNGLVEL